MQLDEVSMREFKELRYNSESTWWEHLARGAAFLSSSEN